MSRPLVSVVFPVFNGGAFLRPALESVLGQSWENLEIIAIDDGSTDESLAQLQRAAASDARIRISSRENRGLVATLNEGLALAKGRFVARMDADDIAYPERIASQVETFRLKPGLGMCGTGFDTLFGERITRGGLDPIYVEGRLDILSKFYTIFIHSTVMFDRDVVGPDVLRYDPAYPHAEDFDLFRRIARAYPIVALEQPQIAYRLHDESVSALRKGEMRQTHIRIVTENLQGLGIEDLDTMADFANAIDGNSIDNLAAFLRGFAAWIERRPDDTRRTWRDGFDQLFYFFYTMVRDHRCPSSILRFLRQVEQNRLVRRRERIVASAQSLLPRSNMLWDGLSRIDALERHFRSETFAKRGQTT